MLNQIKSSLREDTYPLGFSKAVKHMQSGLLAVSAISILSACASTANQAEPMVKTEVTSASQTYVAFAGGGWRAHTGHSAWMVGLLDNVPNTSNTTLDAAFTNVSGISSNSGGSWFNVMLSYSDNFRAGLEKPSASTQYLTDPTAYYANEKNLYQTLSGVTLSPLCSVANDFSNLLAMACMTNLSWDRLVEGIVFGPLNLSSDLSTITMDGKQAWGSRKTIALAATALSGDVVLARSGFLEGHHEYYYDTPDMGPLEVSPVTFAGKANIWDPALKFFPGGTGTFDIEYGRTDRNLTNSAPRNNRDLSSGEINVIHAASGSSAALGFLSSKSINEQNNEALADIRLIMSDWKISYEAENLAIYFNLPDPAKSSTVKRSVVRPQADSDINAAGRFIKIGDGGALDNSGVAHSVLAHQQKHPASTPFEIIAFDNVQKTYSYDPNTLEENSVPVSLIKKVGIDLAFLFGEGYTPIAGTNNSGMCMDKYCVTTKTGSVSQQIFASNALDKAPVWTWSSAGTANSQPCELIYTPYDVTTLDNPMMGVKPGYSGTLHSFTANCPSASTAPFSQADWTAYEDMFNAIQMGLKQGGGLTHLQAAFK